MGAAAAWNVRSTPSPAELARSLDALALGDEAGVLGRAALELGDAHLAARARTVNGSAPFFLLHFADEPLPHPRLEGLDAEGLEACASAIEAAVSELPAARPADPQDALELRFAADLMLAGCRLGLARLRAGGARPAELPRGEREVLASELAGLAERHRSLWAARSRPGGLRDSAGRMERLIELLTARPTDSVHPTQETP
jgi:hypothetical protein